MITVIFLWLSIYSLKKKSKESISAGYYFPLFVMLIKSKNNQKIVLISLVLFIYWIGLRIIHLGVNCRLYSLLIKRHISPLFFIQIVIIYFRTEFKTLS